MKEKEYRTVADLQRVTGLSRSTVVMCIHTGELPGYPLGRQYRIPLPAFEDFIHGRWIPQHRPVFSEPIRPLPNPIRRRTA